MYMLPYISIWFHIDMNIYMYMVSAILDDSFS